MKIELYYAPITCAMAPFIALTEAGAEFEVHALNFRTNEHLTPEYRKINPKHKVPMLVVDGRRMTENVAIHLWVSRTFPDAKLIPADPWEQAQTVSLLSWCSGGIHPYLSRVNNPAKVCATDGSADSIIAKACSAAAMVLPSGEFTTRTPRCVAAGTSTLSTPTPARPMILSRQAAAITFAVT